MTDQHPAWPREGGKGETALIPPTSASKIKHRRLKTIIESRQAADAGPPAISWDAVIDTMPQVKLFVSVLGWCNSAGTNIVTTTQIAYEAYFRRHPAALAGPAWLLLLGIISGLIMFALLTGGQIYALAALKLNPANRKALWLYRVLLLIDGGITAYQWARIVSPFVGAFVDDDRGIMLLSRRIALRANVTIAALVGSTVGLFTAKVPEWLTFGPRQPVEGVADD